MWICLAGQIITQGYNLLQHISGSIFNDPHRLHSTDRLASSPAEIGIDPTLRLNSGETPTHALLPNSWAIDLVPLAVCHELAITDQRGIKRPQGQACDSGAYEYQS